MKDEYEKMRQPKIQWFEKQQDNTPQLYITPCIFVRMVAGEIKKGNCICDRCIKTKTKKWKKSVFYY